MDGLLSADFYVGNLVCNVEVDFKVASSTFSPGAQRKVLLIKDPHISVCQANALATSLVSEESYVDIDSASE